MHGGACKTCTGGKCDAEPSPSEPLLIQCPCCGGVGCNECSHGRVRVESCPRKLAADVGLFLHYVDLYEKGIPPIAGGALDQCHLFNEAAAFAMAERRYWRTKSGAIGLMMGS